MRTKRKLDAWLWFIIPLLPILFSIIYGFAIKDTAANLSFQNLISNLITVLPKDGVVYNTFMQIIQYFVETTENNLIQLLCGYSTYILITKFMHLVVDILAFFIILTEKLIDKAGGTKLNE